MRSHKGAIQLRTAPDTGATFRVLFPAVPAAAAATAVVRQGGSDLRGRGVVLVVDDEEVVRKLAKNALERQGYEVLVAEDGETAIEIVRSTGSRIQVVVLDSGLPGMSGGETLPHLRELNPDLKVIVSSGYSEEEALRLFQNARISGFIKKPFVAQDLARALKSALG